MATLEQLQAGLRAADSAGETQDAQRFADAIRELRAAPQNAPAAPDLGGRIPFPMEMTAAQRAETAPRPVEDPNFMQRAINSAKQGFGDEPLGLSPEKLQRNDATGAVNRVTQNFAIPADLAVRTALAVGRGAGGGLAGLIGANPDEKNRIEREARNFGNYASILNPFNPLRVAGVTPFTGTGAQAEAVIRKAGDLAAPVGRQLSTAAQAVAPPLKEAAQIVGAPFGYGKKSEIEGIRGAGVDVSQNRLLNVLRGMGENVNEATTAAADLGQSASERAKFVKALQQSQAEARAMEAQAQGLGGSQGAPLRYSVEDPRALSASGADAQSAYVANQRKVVDQYNATDAQLRAQVDEIVKGAETQGISIADLPESQRLLQEAQGILRPDVTKAGEITAVGKTLDKNLSSVYQEIENALANKTISLSADEAKIARENGLPVTTIKGSPVVLDEAGKVVSNAIPDRFERTFKTPYEAIENLRRKFGEAFNGDMRGYSGVPEKLLRDKYFELDKIQNAFVKEARPDMQANWASLRGEVDRLGSGIGKKLLSEGADQMLSANQTQIVKGIINRGLPGVREYLEKSGNPQATLKLASDALQSELYGITNAADAAKKLATDTPLGEVYRGLPELLGPEGAKLKTGVDNWLAGLNRVESAAAREKGIETTVKANEDLVGAANTSVEGNEKLVESLKKRREALKGEEAVERTAIIETQNLSPDKVLTRVKDLYEDASEKGQITPQAYEDMLNRIKGAEKLIANGERKDRALSTLWRTTKTAGKWGAILGAAALGGAYAPTVPGLVSNLINPRQQR